MHPKMHCYYIGSFLVMVMRIISLGFDLDPTFAAKDGEKEPPKVMYLPNFMEYMGYCLFPTTSIFGPFLGFNEHTQLLDPSPIVSMRSVKLHHHFILLHHHCATTRNIEMGSNLKCGDF